MLHWKLLTSYNLACQNEYTRTHSYTTIKLNQFLNVGKPVHLLVTLPKTANFIQPLIFHYVFLFRTLDTHKIVSKPTKKVIGKKERKKERRRTTTTKEHLFAY